MFSKEELTELYLFLTGMIIEYVKRPNCTMYQLCKIVDVYKKVGEMLKEAKDE